MDTNDLDEYSYVKVVERLKIEQNKKNGVDNLLAESLQKIKLSQNLKLQDEHGPNSSSESESSPETTSLNQQEGHNTSDNPHQKLQLRALNDKILSLQNLAIIYQDQYVARRNAKQIPHYFTQG
jgi:hypothetical protein